MSNRDESPTVPELTIEDEHRIAAIILRYGAGIDRRDWDLFRTCFTDDFHGDYGSFGSWNGADAFTAVMQAMHEPMGATLHRMSNILAKASAEGATARTYVDAILTAKEADGPLHQGIGYYDDLLVKTGEGWKIRTRRFTPVRLT